jgi:hypothetical protein
MAKDFKAYRFLAVLVGAVALSFPVWADPPAQVGRLNHISGQVSFQSGSLDEWVPATLNYPLTAGDHLWTDVGARAEVHVLSAALRLDSSTEFSFVNLDDQTVQVRLTTGSLNVTLRGLDAGDVFEINTPNASISMLAAGTYRVDVQASGGTEVTVRQGNAEVTAGGGAFDVLAGQFTAISGSDSVAYYVAGASAPDEWDAWCQTRDQREDRIESVRYVPREMIGAEDLDENGTWLVEAGYGPVWAPSRVPSGWAPYRFGRWAWVEPWGWTWIDDTPWGFAPFHYGRWAFLGARWVWVPGAMVARPLYAPALVVFVGGSGWSPDAGEGIGWFPLGPREVYIPPYQVSTRYVQRINIAHVTTITVQTIETFNVNHVVYVNRTVPRALTFVPHDVFVQSRPAAGGMLSVSAAEIMRAPLMGMTARVAPQRESVFAQPFAPRSPVAQPSPDLMRRRVYTRTAPPPQQVPFATRQQSLTVNPGRPLDAEALLRFQRTQPSAAPTVTMVRPSMAPRPEAPRANRSGPQAVPPAERQPGVTVAPAGRQERVNAPASPPVRQPGVTVAPGGRQERVNAPASPAERQPGVTVAPGGRQERVNAPAPPPVRQPAVNAPGNRGNSEVAAQINALRTRSLPDAEQRLAAARGVAGIRLDLNAAARQLSAARAALAGAEQDLAGGNAGRAQQTVAAAQRQIEDQMRLISAAIQAAKQSR